MVTTVFCLFLPTLAHCQTEGGWATVDTRILLMMHPDMAGFDYANSRFFREKKLDKDINKVVAELKKAHEKSAMESAPLREKQKKVMQDRFALMQKRTRAIQVLAPGDLERLERSKIELQTAYRELERQRPTDRTAEKLFLARKADITRRLEDIQGYLTGSGTEDERRALAEKLHQQIGELDRSLAELAAEIGKIQDKAVASVYLTGEETATRLEKIKNEINSLIQQAAKDSKIAVVMDSSFAMRSRVRKDKLSMIPAVEEAPDIVSASLFHSFANLTIDPALEKKLTGPEGSPLPPAHLTVGRSLGMRSNLKQYLDFRNYMPEKVADFSGGRPFLVGGTDLTPWVARQLFERYKVPEFVKNSYMQLIREYLDVEKDPVQRPREY
jgi:hypothetical protein